MQSGETYTNKRCRWCKTRWSGERSGEPGARSDQLPSRVRVGVRGWFCSYHLNELAGPLLLLRWVDVAKNWGGRDVGFGRQQLVELGGDDRLNAFPIRQPDQPVHDEGAELSARKESAQESRRGNKLASEATEGRKMLARGRLMRGPATTPRGRQAAGRGRAGFLGAPLSVVGGSGEHACPLGPRPDKLKVGEVVGQPLCQPHAQVKIHDPKARKTLAAREGAGGGRTRVQLEGAALDGQRRDVRLAARSSAPAASSRRRIASHDRTGHRCSWPWGRVAAACRAPPSRFHTESACTSAGGRASSG